MCRGVVTGAGVIPSPCETRNTEGGRERPDHPPASFVLREWSEQFRALRRNMRITFYRCDRSWASIASKNESHPRVSATLARREFKMYVLERIHRAELRERLHPLRSVTV